jgi:hypothetical protein
MQLRTRKIVVLLFALAALAAISCAIYLSLNPDYFYFRNPEDRASWAYPSSSVAFVCGVMLVEALVACLAVVANRPRALWFRCLLGLLLIGPWSFFSTMFVVHMPGYILFHHLWVWLLVLVVALVGITSAIRQLYLRLRGGPPNNSFKPTPLRGAA